MNTDFTANPAQAWEGLVAAALLGTARAPVPSSEAISAERALLDSAAALAAFQRAAALPTATQISPPAAAPPEDRPLCTARAGALLRYALEWDKLPMRLWLTACARTGQLARPEYLPALLHYGRYKQDKEARPLILHVIGARGRWLAAQHGDWRFALAAPEPLPPTPEPVVSRSFESNLRESMRSSAGRRVTSTTWSLLAQWPHTLSAPLTREVIAALDQTIRSGVGGGARTDAAQNERFVHLAALCASSLAAEVNETLTALGTFSPALTQIVKVCTHLLRFRQALNQEFDAQAAP
jgi:hypothetical protein